MKAKYAVIAGVKYGALKNDSCAPGSISGRMAAVRDVYRSVGGVAAGLERAHVATSQTQEELSACFLSCIASNGTNGMIAF